MAVDWPKKQLFYALLFGVLSGAVGWVFALTPWGHEVEERFGLAWLFQLRGPLSPPERAVVVAIDKDASDRLDVPYDTKQWPRDIHAELLEGLTASGARVVTFDLSFRSARESEDVRFAAAIRNAGNVALFEFLQKEQPGMVADAERLTPVIVQQRLPPTPVLAEAAAGSGPFTLPKVPERVSRFWTFDDNAAGAPSLAVVALLLYAAPEYRELRERLMIERPEAVVDLPDDLVELVTQRGAVAAAETLSDAIPWVTESGSAARSQTQPPDVLRAVIEALDKSPSRYVNFFGPPQTLQTVSYAQALHDLSAGAGRQKFADKAVFVGVSSPVQWHLQDEFLTVFSDPVSGMDLSGTEILATGFANLLERQSIQPASAAVVAVTLVAWGLVIGILAWLLRPLPALLMTGLAALLYLFLALKLFAGSYIWLPLFIPLLIQLPGILFGSILWQHRRARADLNRISDTFGHYLPRATVDRLVREGFQPLEDRRTVFGVCLMTDAQGYTSVAEKLPSDRLVDLINDYLEVIIRPVRQHGGEVSDIKGDSVMAFWASRQDDLAIRTAACRAMSDIHQAVQAWNGSNDYRVRLPTRIGLHCGSMTLASVGAADHFEQRAVGDIVNTSSRLEQLSKELGTQLLVSAETLKDVEGAVTRCLGWFRLKGRTSRLQVHEWLGWEDEAVPEPVAGLAEFSAGITAYEKSQWGEAEAAFMAAIEQRGHDPVAHWYLGQVADRQADPDTGAGAPR